MRLLPYLTLALSASLPQAARAQEPTAARAEHPPALEDRIGDGEFEVVDPAASGLHVGDRVNLRDYLGKPVILEFWATWCTGCRIQHAVVADLVKRYGTKIQAFAVLYEDSPEHVRAWLKRNESTFPTVLDVDGAMASTFWVNSLPRLALLDQRQRLSWDDGGGWPVDSIVVRIDRMLARQRLRHPLQLNE